jgi:hypothetical protein
MNTLAYLDSVTKEKCLLRMTLGIAGTIFSFLTGGGTNNKESMSWTKFSA